MYCIHAKLENWDYYRVHPRYTVKDNLSRKNFIFNSPYQLQH